MEKRVFVNKTSKNTKILRPQDLKHTLKGVSTDLPVLKPFSPQNVVKNAEKDVFSAKRQTVAVESTNFGKQDG